MDNGLVDVHAHLIPAVDDGCDSVAESLDCARMLVRAGYAHAFCTPHVWPHLPSNTPANIARWTRELQARLDEAAIPLRLHSGGEISIQPFVLDMDPDDVPTYGMAGRYALMDFWADDLPDFFQPVVKHLQAMGITIILGHPERVRVVQRDPAIVDRFLDMGLLMQGNLKCLSDPLGSANRVTVEHLLLGGRYFMLGSDLHNLDTLPALLHVAVKGKQLNVVDTPGAPDFAGPALAALAGVETAVCVISATAGIEVNTRRMMERAKQHGLGRAIELVGRQTVEQLTIHNPRTLLTAPA